MIEQLKELDRLHEAVKQAVYKKIDAASDLAAVNSHATVQAYLDAYREYLKAREAYMRAVRNLK